MAHFEKMHFVNPNKFLELFHDLPSDQQDIYFRPGYYQLYESINDGAAKFAVFTKDNNLALYPFLLNSINSLDFKLDQHYYDIQGCYGYNGILSSTKSEDFLNAFYHSFSQFCTRNNVIAEFTRFHPLLNNQAFSEKFMVVTEDRETVVVELKKEYSEIWESEYSSKNRNMIRKAAKKGYNIEVLRNPTEENLNKFIEIYYFSMEKAEADQYYFFKKEYFTNIFAYLSGHAFLFNVVDNEREVVCSSIFFQYGDYFHYHLSGRNDKADNSVNNFLLDQAVIFAKSNRAKLFHLGGGRSSDKNDSLLKFKKNFSKKTLPFYIGKRIHNSSVYDEVVRQWAERYPERMNVYKNHLLKYRF